VIVEMAVCPSDSARRAVSVKLLNRIVELVEGVGEVVIFGTGERVRPKAALVPGSPPFPATGSAVPTAPRRPY
jgi:hypothetical protein